MVEIIGIIYFFYILIKIYIAIMQIGTIDSAKKQPPVLLSPSNYIKAACYAKDKEKLSIASTLAEYALFLFWIGFGLSWLDNLLTLQSPLLKSVLFVDLFVTFNFVALLPFELYGKFVLDGRYGFNKSTPALYAIDLLKGALLFIFLGSLLVAALSAVIEYVKYWWIAGFLLLFGVIILVNALYPTLIAPIFNTFSPLEDEELKSRIERLLERVGFKSSGIFVVDASKRDSRLNAYFGGFGKTKRVVLFDTLVKKLDYGELISVLGHELGHFKNRDIFKNIALIGLVLLALFALFGNLPDSLFWELGLEPSSHALIALFLLVSPALTFFIMPILSYISRKNEYAADEFGAAMGSREEMILALLKLVDENRAFPHSHPLAIFFYHSHPPILKRLRALGYVVAEDEKGLLKGECAANAY